MSAKKDGVRNVLITGATSGLGLSVSKAMLDNGWRVFGTGRKPVIATDNEENFRFIYADFLDLQQTDAAIRKLCAETSFDLVINNAGILSPPDFRRTIYGFECTLQVNFIAHMLVNEIIIRTSRIDVIPDFISVTSPVWRLGDLKRAHSMLRSGGAEKYRPFNAYSDSKLLMVLLFARYAERFKQSQSKFISYDPGVFSSGIYRLQKGYFRFLYKIAAPFMRSPDSVARSILKLVCSPELQSGAIYDSKVKSFKLPEPSKEFELIVNDLVNSINFTS